MKTKSQERKEKIGNLCKECGKLIQPKSKYCNKCSQIGERNHNFQKRGNKNHNWKGGRLSTLTGYIYIYKPEHPFCTKLGYILEHRLVMEEYLGRYLTKDERIHHINSITSDNRIENLWLCKNEGEHSKLHKNMEEFVFNLFKEKLINFNNGNYYITIEHL